jgi:hypothetical protein
MNRNIMLHNIGIAIYFHYIFYGFLALCINYGENFISAIYAQSVTISAHKMKYDSHCRNDMKQ